MGTLASDWFQFRHAFLTLSGSPLGFPFFFFLIRVPAALLTTVHLVVTVDLRLLFGKALLGQFFIRGEDFGLDLGKIFGGGEVVGSQDSLARTWAQEQHNTYFVMS